MSHVLNKKYPSDAEEKLRALNRLSASAKLINAQQYNALKEKVEDNLDLDDVIWQLKQVKIGRGINIPRLTNGLFDQLKDSIAEYHEEKSAQLRDKLLALLDELLQRKAISKRDYKDKIEQHNLD